MPSHDSRPAARLRELEIERLVLREPNGGRVRAIFEACPPWPPGTGAPVPAVRLSLLGPDGAPQLTLDVDDAGEPTIHVGPTGSGTTVVLSRSAADCWHLGNIVATLRSTDDGGRIELSDAQGRTALELPPSPQS